MQQIQNEAVDASNDLSNLLRKCQILAYKLKNDEFKKWVKFELDGYNSFEILPNYRKLTCSIYGDFGTPGALLSDQQISWKSMFKELKQKGLEGRISTLGVAQFRQGVKAIQACLVSEHAQFSSRLQQDIIDCMSEEGALKKGMTLLDASKVYDKSAVIGLLDTVRNKVLEFSLELQEKFPDLDFEQHQITESEKQTVQNVYNHCIISDTVGNAAQNSQDFVQS